MKVSLLTLLFATALVFTNAAEMNPLEKVLEMLGGLQSKLIAEGQGSQDMYNKFSAWCEKRSQELHFEVKTGKAQVSSLSASIDKGVSDATVLESGISDSASDIADDESELKAATNIRSADAKVFADLEKELVTTVDMLERAMSVIAKEMNGGAFLQANLQTNAQGLMQAMKAMVEASSVSSSDAARLTALIQSSASASSNDEDSEDMLGAPSAAATENQSGGIVEVLQGLLDKAEEQLASARKEESNAKQEYAMKKASLEDSRSLGSKSLTDGKSGLAGAKEKTAVNEGDLTTTQKDLQEDIKELAELHRTCLTKATDFEEETKSRADELGALATAKKILTETTGGAASQQYGLLDTDTDTSFLQVKASSSFVVEQRALRILKRLARSEHSVGLTQLASRAQSTFRLGSVDGGSPFDKVKGMIVDMLASLQKQAEAEAGEKEYCDKEMGETKATLDDKTDEAQSLSTKIAQQEGSSKKLKGEVATLQNELAALVKAQGEMDQLRQQENAAYKKNRPEMEQGLSGVKAALKVLKDYYAKPAFVQMEAGSKGANEIIGLLEVAESDFSKLVAEMIAEEEQAQTSYDETTKENAVAKTTKEQDAKFKTREAAGLDKSSAEIKNDLGGVSDELSAVQEYNRQLEERCNVPAPSYEEIKKRREAEIAGLKDALVTLGGDSSLLQERRALRGIHRM